ncbi:hypothetical protein RRG08_022421 [Elysia crispata]|uniref:Uncharacterized protein n=1 Tax=Elysia crispata TaxID=231223 RepID=A0AAE0Z154_9GAST|nr:hypothetical protein RRG08_022421 [Elysia crispata]
MGGGGEWVCLPHNLTVFCSHHEAPTVLVVAVWIAFRLSRSKLCPLLVRTSHHHSVSGQRGGSLLNPFGPQGMDYIISRD